MWLNNWQLNAPKSCSVPTTPTCSPTRAINQALCEPGDTVLGMSVADGGHLTHGAKPSFSSKTYNAIHYGLDNATGEVDCAQVEALALEHKPKLIIAGFSAYSRIMVWLRWLVIPALYRLPMW